MSRDRAQLLDFRIDRLTMTESVAAAKSLIESRGVHQHVVVNAAKVVEGVRNPEVRRVINDSDMVNADGQAVVWASRLLGDPLPERVAGIDFMAELWQLAIEENYGVYLLGARPEVVSAVADIARERGVRVVGARDGFWTPVEEGDVVTAIRAASPDLLFVAIPSPRKELFLSQHLMAMNVPLSVGVGGSFDVVAGVTKRAPRWMQGAGLEWLYRLAQEPRRMCKRYLAGNSRFVWLVGRDFVQGRLRRPS